MKQYRTHLLVCAGTACVSSGSFKVKDALEQEVKKRNLQDEVLVIATGCNGFCERGPIVMVHPDGIFYQQLKVEDVPLLVEEHLVKGRPLKRLMYIPPAEKEPVPKMKDIEFFKHQRLIVLRNRGRLDPEKVEEYIAFDGYAAMAKALTKMTPKQIIVEVTAAGLRGRGGAGFSTGKKWEACRQAKGKPKYLICNGDEGDPGAYMDRSVLEADPHAVLEGMVIGAKAIRAEKGFIYIRNEYPLAVKRVEIAIQQAKAKGLLGKDILGTGFDFDLEIVQGAGAFVSGEETSLMASIEGRRAYPRQRPPYPAQSGLWGRPTNINNVETWANIPPIIGRGAAWFSSIGTETSKGTKIFSLVGKINNTGLVEVPMGITLRKVIFDIGGGIKNGKKFKAVQTGGPSGGCLPAEKLDLAIDYEALTEAGSIMGSGGMIVMDEDNCMVDVARYFLNFTQEESCGKCVPCRVGTRQLKGILSRITEGRGELADLESLERLARTVTSGSLCGLGQTAPKPVLSTLRYFRNEYLEHILKKQCSALVCKEIISAPCQYTCPIDQEASVYIALIAQGRYREAYDIIRKDNPLPAVCGRVCHHPCEARCKAGEYAEPISIRALKRFVCDWARQNGYEPAIALADRNGRRVAVIGSGPAGLAAGHYLNLKGYAVTVFEAESVPGGMLKTAIPDHRLPKDVLAEDIENIFRKGVELRTNRTLGKDFVLDDLFREGFEAVFIATGAHASMRLAVPGEEAEGIVQGIKFLKDIHLGREVKIGRRVGIIGGGNAAVDAARVALRQKGCEKVTILYRRTRLEMPAFPEEVESALEEGVDIKFLVAPLGIVEQDQKVVALNCQLMKLGQPDASGRRRPEPVEGSTFAFPLDTIIPAIGERPDLSFLTGTDQVKVSKWETIEADAETFYTSRKGVFSGGDVVTGPGTVVVAMAAGKTAAETIDQFLKGQAPERTYKLSRPSVYIPPVELTEEEIANARRPGMPKRTVAERIKNHQEVDLGLTEAQALREARRCLRCELETEDGKSAMGRKS